MLRLISSTNNIALHKGMPRLDFGDTMDAIFIIKAMLVAIVSDTALRPAKATMTIAMVRQSSAAFEKNDNVSEGDFFKLSDQFYFSISQLSRLKRVSTIILQEKEHIDRVLKLALRDWTDYKTMNSLYVKFLNSVQLNSIEATLNAIYSLAHVLEGYTILAKENYPDFFELKKSSVNNNSKVTSST